MSALQIGCRIWTESELFLPESDSTTTLVTRKNFTNKLKQKQRSQHKAHECQKQRLAVNHIMLNRRSKNYPTECSYGNNTAHCKNVDLMKK